MSKLSGSRKPRRWRRVALISLGSLTLLLAVVYLVVTSSVFITAVILPQIGKSLHATLSAETASLDRLSAMDLRHLTLRVPGDESILEVQEVKARFDLRKLLRGDIAIRDVVILSPTVRLVQNEDGSLNIDPLFVRSNRPGRPAKSSPPTVLDIHNVALVQATIDIILKGAEGARQTIHLSGVNATLDQIVANKRVNLALSLGARIEQTAAKATTSVLVRTAMKANFAFTLDAQSIPDSMRGSLKCDLLDAPMATNFSGASLVLDADLNRRDNSKLDLRLSRKDTALGRLSASGPFDFLSGRGRLVVDVTEVDRRLLDLVGGVADLDFNQATVNWHNEIDVGEGARKIDVTGMLRIDRLSVTAGKQEITTPVLNLSLSYHLDADPISQSARIEKLECEGRGNGVPFLTTKLSQPMTVSWGSGVQAPETASLSVTVTNLDLADWRPLAGRFVQNGKLNAVLNFASSQGEKSVATDLAARLQDLTFQIGTNQCSPSDLEVRLRGRLEKLTKVTLDDCRVDYSRSNQPAVSLSGAGTYNLKTRAANVSTRIVGNLPAALSIVPYSGASLSAGKATLDAKIAATRTSRQINLNAVLTNVTGTFRGVGLDHGAMALDTVAQFQRRRVTLTKCTARVDQAGQKSANLDLTGDYSFATESGRARVSLDAVLPPVLQTFPCPPLKLSSGDLKFTGKITSTGSSHRITGSLGISRVGGQIAGATFTRASLLLDTSVNLKNQTWTLERFTGAIEEGGLPGGTLDLTGFYAPGSHSGKFNVALDGLNQQTLGPFFATAFKNKALLSVSISEKGSARLEPSGNFSIKSKFAITNLIVKDFKTGKTDAPVWTDLQVDASMRDHQLDLRSFRAALSPTRRANNVLDLRGRLDLTKSNSVTGEVEVAAESIDATPFYDLYTGRTTTNAAKPMAGSIDQSRQEDQEPEAINLPFENLKVSARLGKVFLHDLTVTNFETSAEVRDSKIQVGELRFWLNGAPLEASGAIDLSVPGYKYDMTLRANKLPLEPVMDLFDPEDRGQYRGVIIADARLQGAGLTGADFKHNLLGTVFLSFTNADIRVIGPKLQLILLPISLVLRIPEILRSPLHCLSCHVLFAQGQMDVKDTTVEAEAFSGRASGVIPLAKVLGDSPLRNLPVDFMLARSLAKRADLMPNNTPANVTYVKVPSFIKLKGTLGNPKTDISEFGVARILVNSTTGILTKPAGSLLRGVERFLTGGSSNSKTNSAATNAVPVQNEQPNPGEP